MNAMKTPAWVVRKVHPRADYTLLLTFANGEERVYNARPLLEEELYSQLRGRIESWAAPSEYAERAGRHEGRLPERHLRHSQHEGENVALLRPVEARQHRVGCQHPVEHGGVFHHHERPPSGGTGHHHPRGRANHEAVQHEESYA